jgi:ribosomal peptide maturation radical SAM protein 1
VTRIKVILVIMPFASIDRPALGVSTLKAGLQALGIECRVVYLNVVFAERLGAGDYERVADGLPYTSLVGEWIFVEPLYGRDVDREAAYVRRILRGTWRLNGDDLDLIERARSLVPAFLEDCLASSPWGECDLVGFSSYCAQNTASLALAKLIKAENPRILVAFGGHNWEGEMGRELFSRFPFVDVAFSGPADGSFPAFLQRVQRGDSSWDDIPGLLYRAAGRPRAHSAAACVEDLDALPVPDHDDYFEALHRSRFAEAVRPSVPVETTRGCWWAAQGPCLFCGQNGLSLSFRSKSPDRTLDELRRLSVRWKGHPLVFVDNVVSPHFLSAVLPRLAADPLSSPLSFMVRCDIGRQQVRLIKAADASIRSGIESLSGHLLRLMRKGTTALENIRLLKWCSAYGVDHHWNLLYGCPGETARDYRDLIETIRSLRFLEPPDGCAPVLIERFSRYFDDPARYGFGQIRPLEAYSFVYPFPETAVRRIAYFFDHDYCPSLGTLIYMNKLRTEVEQWRTSGAAGELRRERESNGRLVLVDTRAGRAVTRHLLDRADQLLYEACDDIGSLGDLCELAHAQLDAGISKEEVAGRLSALVERRLMAREEDCYLSLALPEGTLSAGSRPLLGAGAATRAG